MPPGRLVVVWGNCQAAPVAALLREPLRRAGLEVVDVPPVFEVDAAGLDRVRALVAQAAVLVTQPVRDEYRIPGCGSAQLAELLPPGARVVTWPSIFHLGAFPYVVNAHGGDGERVDAPRTVYHDLRLLAAAAHGRTADQVLANWPVDVDPGAVQTLARSSTEELARREGDLDVRVAALLDRPGAMFAIDHPSNHVLAAVARGVLAALGQLTEVAVPAREFLGHTRIPIEPAVAGALGWPPPTQREWVAAGQQVEIATVVREHLTLYDARPDIPMDAQTRYAGRLAALGL